MELDSKPNRIMLLGRDLRAGLIVFLVALPLCLGVAIASKAPPESGLVAGMIGGLLVGLLSGSHTSVSGPAAGLTAVVMAQIAILGSFEAFLAAVALAGVIQIGLGLMKAGALSAFFPSSVIKGLLAAIGVILILKQIPHLFGHDTDPVGESSFSQPDQENTFSEFGAMINDMHMAAAVIGLISVAVLVIWDRVKFLKKSVVPAPLIVVLLGVGLNIYFRTLGGSWVIEDSHLVSVPVAGNISELSQFLRFPDFSGWSDPALIKAAITIAIVASLETLLNLEAVDRIDPKQRQSPPNRELLAQGVGNLAAGLIGGIPVTSVIVRSSVNINAGGQTKISAIFHGVLLVVCVAMLPTYVNMIPVSCLAAILIVTGFKLASPKLFKQMWAEGRYQFLPFIITLVAIVLTDLLVGIIIGLVVSVGFILNSNLRRPIRRIRERHLGGEVLHVELPNQVSFLNRAALESVLRSAERGVHVLLDARRTDYIDPDVLSLIKDFRDVTAPVQGVRVSLRGFRDRYKLEDSVQFVDYSTRELQSLITPTQVLQILQLGNDRFRKGQRLKRDWERQLNASADGQHPLAVVLSCIDSRAPVEVVFDLGLGDVLSTRVAGNVVSRKILGSVEYGCAVAGVKLILVLGHTQCGAVAAAMTYTGSAEDIERATGCQHLHPVVGEIHTSIESRDLQQLRSATPEKQCEIADLVTIRNVANSVERIYQESDIVRRMIEQNEIAIVGAVYRVATGEVEFLPETCHGQLDFTDAPRISTGEIGPLTVAGAERSSES